MSVVRPRLYFWRVIEADHAVAENMGAAVDDLKK